MNEREKSRLAAGEPDGILPKGIRLVCQTYAFGDVRIRVPARRS